MSVLCSIFSHNLHNFDRFFQVIRRVLEQETDGLQTVIDQVASVKEPISSKEVEAAVN